MYCLDTNIIVDLFRKDEKLKEKILSIKSQNKEISTTTINLCELYKGVYLSKNLQGSEKDIDDLMDSVPILTQDKFSAKEFGREFARLQRLGKMTQEIDLMIAAIAKANNLILVTRNKKDFENINVKIEVW